MSGSPDPRAQAMPRNSEPRDPLSRLERLKTTGTRHFPMVCRDVPGMSRCNRWSGAPASETVVISRLVRLQQASRSDSGSCSSDQRWPIVGLIVGAITIAACQMWTPGVRRYGRAAGW
jgi:hypothetical protein